MNLIALLAKKAVSGPEIATTTRMKIKASISASNINQIMGREFPEVKGV